MPTEKGESQGIFTKIGVGLGLKKDTFANDAAKHEAEEVEAAATKKKEILKDAKMLEKEADKEVRAKQDKMLEDPGCPKAVK